MAEQCQNFDTARPRPSSVKIFFSNFDTARPWPSRVKILTLLGRGRAVSKFFSNFDTARPGRARPRPSSVKIFFSNFDTARPWPSSVKILTLLGRGRAVSKFFFQILTLLGRGRAVSKFFFQILTLHCSAVAVVALPIRTRARACLRLLSYEIAARARAFTQWPSASAMAVSREV